MPTNYQHINFKEFYDEYFHQVYQFLKNRTNDHEDAKDLAHDVFLKAYQNFEKIVQADCIDKYLFTISRNTLVDYYKKTTAHKKVSFDLETIETPDHNEGAYSTEQIGALHQSIASLPKQRREIIKRKKLQGHSSKEIAEEFEVSIRTVENQIYRAMLSLRKQMAQKMSSFF